MDVDPAVGKIVGMLMAYGVSALGLLLAYVNYRKRIVKADRVFTPAAWAVFGLVCGAAVLVFVLVAAAMSAPDQPRGQAILGQLGGILVPGVVFAASFWLTWKLYRRFSRQKP